MNDPSRITYYDFSNLLYSSYYLTGFAGNAVPFNYQFSVSKSPPGLITATHPEWAYILLFKATTIKDEFYFCIDTSDSNRFYPTRRNGYSVSILDQVKYYFKVNHSEQAIGFNHALQPFAVKIMPALPFLPIKPPRSVRYFPRPIPCRAAGWTVFDALRRFKHLNDMPTLKYMRQLRGVKEDLDVFFVVNFTGKSEHAENDEYRYTIMQELRRYPKINAKVGFVSRTPMTGPFADFQVNRLSLKDYLEHLARARIAIYVRGLHNCLSFKFMQLLALGKPIVGQPIANNIETIMKYDRFDEQFTFEDPQELVSRALDMLKDPVKRVAIGKSNAITFDTKLDPSVVVCGILERIGLRRSIQ